MRWPTRSRGATCDLRDELGDLLLQVVYHAQHGRGARRVRLRRRRRGDHRQDDPPPSARLRRRPGAGRGDGQGLLGEVKAEEKARARAARTARGLPAEDHGDGWLDGVPVALPALSGR